MYSLPTTVTVNDLQFHIRNRGDFRMVLDCFDALQDTEMSEDYRVLASLLIFYNELNSIQDVNEYADCIEELVKEMYKFLNGGEDDSFGAHTDIPVIDWAQDEQIISAAINNVAHQEIRSAEYIHWWTFLGYYMSIGQSVLATVVGIRNKIAHHKKLEKWEQEFKRDNPKYFVWRQTVEEKDAEQYIRNLWNKGGDN